METIFVMATIWHQVHVLFVMESVFESVTKKFLSFFKVEGDFFFKFIFCVVPPIYRAANSS